MKQLPLELTAHAVVAMGRRTLHKVQIFERACENGAFVYELASRLVPKVIDPGTVIMRKGERGSDMYFVTYGTCRVDTGSITIDLKKGAFFGEIALLHNVKRTATISAWPQGFVNVLRLEKRDFDDVMELFPECLSTISLAAKTRLDSILAAEESDLQAQLVLKRDAKVKRRKPAVRISGVPQISLADRSGIDAEMLQTEHIPTGDEMTHDDSFDPVVNPLREPGGEEVEASYPKRSDSLDESLDDLYSTDPRRLSATARVPPGIVRASFAPRDSAPVSGDDEAKDLSALIPEMIPPSSASPDPSIVSRTGEFDSEQAATAGAAAAPDDDVEAMKSPVRPEDPIIQFPRLPADDSTVEEDLSHGSHGAHADLGTLSRGSAVRATSLSCPTLGTATEIPDVPTRDRSGGDADEAADSPDGDEADTVDPEW